MGKELCHYHKVTKGMTSVTEWSHHCHKCVTGSHMTGNMKTIGSEVVYNHNSSCIYSVENQMGTLSSSSC